MQQQRRFNDPLTEAFRNVRFLFVPTGCFSSGPRLLQVVHLIELAWLVRLSLCCLHCTLQYGVPHVQPQLSFLSTSVASVTSVKLSSELCHSVPVSAACQI